MKKGETSCTSVLRKISILTAVWCPATSLLLALAAVCQVVGALQTFDQQPLYTEVNPGQTALLLCKVSNKQGHCSWQKDGFPIGAEEAKYEWAGSPELGDCSLRVLGADLKYDDGQWSCQVTASSFQTQDALKSAPAALVVRVEPQRPQLEHRGSVIQSGQNLTVTAGQPADVQCRARYGNPPANIKWFLGERELTEFATQRNQTELDNPQTSAALSVLSYTFGRQMAGRAVRCVALHRAYDTESRDTLARLDILYAPEVELHGRPDTDIEENIDTVTLRCAADANPAAAVVWRFVSRETGRSETFYVPTLELSPVTRKNSGTYSCEAGNSIGKSGPLTTSLDVKYAPSALEVGPQPRVSVALHNSTTLTCEADAYPPPQYQWLQRLPIDGDSVYVRGAGPLLRIDDASYQSQGQYVCVATNVINGRQRRVQSDVVTVHVTGGPQISREGATVAAAAAAEPAVPGARATLEAVFCADPPASLVSWLWDQSELQAGNARGRFVADEMVQEPTEDCYRARLHVHAVRAHDQRSYQLLVRNQLGVDRLAVALRVQEPVSMTTVISLVCGCLVALVLVAALLLFAFRRRKCCFSNGAQFKTVHMDSQLMGETAVPAERRPAGRLGAIPPDALYSGSKPARHFAAYTPQADEEAAESQSESGGSQTAAAGVIYADLQLPKTSNNGSMRRHQRHTQSAPAPAHRRSHVTVDARDGDSSEPTQLPRTEYAQIKFVPKIDHSAEI